MADPPAGLIRGIYHSRKVSESEACVHAVHLGEGEERNIKGTKPLDLPVAEVLLEVT